MKFICARGAFSSVDISNGVSNLGGSFVIQQSDEGDVEVISAEVISEGSLNESMEFHFFLVIFHSLVSIFILCVVNDWRWR